MTPSNAFEAEAPRRLIDHRQVAWASVKRTRYLLQQRFHYSYPGPIRNLRHRLMVVPARRYGDQRLCEHKLTITPQAPVSRSLSDAFGNEVLEVKAPSIDAHLVFELCSTVERAAKPQPASAPSLGADFLQPTPLTRADRRIKEVARALRAATKSPLGLAEAISDWVAQTMRYGFGATGVRTTAAAALAVGTGLCQDYSHIMLALCREAGLPARYVSGHMLGEGGSHAWVEVLIAKAPGQGRYEVHVFDPTNRRRPDLRYLTVAVGRDYSDVAPTSGSFVAPYRGRLTFTKRAGLTLVEYADGRTVIA